MNSPIAAREARTYTTSLLYLKLDKGCPWAMLCVEWESAVGLNFTYVVENLTPSNLKVCAGAQLQDIEWKSLKNRKFG